MTLTVKMIRSLVASTMLAVGVMQGDAGAQTYTTPTQNNLNLRESGGQPRGYAFLLHTPVNGTIPEANVLLKPENKLIPPDQWTWKLFSSEAELRTALTTRWYAQAACPDDLTKLQVIGPAGTLTQSPLWNPIWGYFQTQSYTIDTVRDVCVNWSNDNTCDTTEPGCVKEETFNLVGGVGPASSADRLRLKASCSSGPVADTYYASPLRLICRRDSNY
jgi:hypothetical protein